MQTPISCGIFLYDAVNELLLITKSFGSRKFEGYSIPKGLFDESDSNYEEAARREFVEECGVDLSEIDATFVKEFPLVPYPKSSKKLKSYLYVSNSDLSHLNFQCNSYFEKDGESFPEISSFHWVTLEEAKSKLHSAQSILISELKNALENDY